MNIPSVVKDNLAWALVSATGFLFAFFVNATYVRADQLEAYQTDIVKAMEMGRLEDQIWQIEDQILMLSIYIEESPQSDLNKARLRRMRELEVRLERLERELEKFMMNGR